LDGWQGTTLCQPFSFEVPMLVKVGGSQVDVRVEACFAMPRLGFNDNFFTWAQAFIPLGIRPTKCSGAFWDQCNTRVFEMFLDKCEYILACDYDSFFTKEDIEHLFAMAMTFQCDALTGLQCKREDGRPMMTLKDTLDKPPAEGQTELPMSWFAEPVQEVDSAHFGCTVISTAALKRAKKPWFLGVPNKEQTWGDGRLDPDIYFWKNWRDSGNRVFITPRVVLGHGEYMITWPGKDLGKPVYQYATQFCNTLERPETAWRLPQS
jgi:hypothetical protein